MAFSLTPLVLFCDFGLPYIGQMKARMVEVLGADVAHHPIIDLFHDAPKYDVRAGSVLLAAHANDFPLGSVFVCVVDPGVGSSARRPGVVFAGGRWFVGPLNGLFEHVLRRWPDKETEVYEITWVPEHLSASFHGRDLFAPVAARIARGGGARIDGLAAVAVEDVRHKEFEDDVAAVIYADDFGNLVTGVRWNSLKDDATLEVQGLVLPRARTFSDVEPGTLFVYENAVGLVEISANQQNAQNVLDIGPGTRVIITQV